MNASSLGAKGGFDEWNHVVSVAKMEIGLNGEKAFGARNRTLACSDVPSVAEGILGLAPAIARRMVVRGRIDRSCAGFKGAGISGIGIRDIQVSGHGTLRILLIGIPELDDRIPDGYFGVHDGTVRARDADALGAFEGGDKEFDEFRSTVKEIGCDVREVGRRN